jgi:hypothetical protein
MAQDFNWFEECGTQHRIATPSAGSPFWGYTPICALLVNLATVVCQERIRLVADYRETTRIYADFVREMSDLVGLGPESEVDLLRGSCRLAWDAAERGRLALSRHECNHSCNRSNFQESAVASDRQNSRDHCDTP